MFPMSGVRARGEDVRRYIVDNVENFPHEISRKTAEKFGITRQAVNKHLRRLTKEKCLLEEGETRNRVYKLAALASWEKVYDIDGLPEDIVWRDDIAPALGELPDNVRNIWLHGFTEMFNNAIDHSGGATIAIQIKRTAASTEMFIVDDGVGIFRKIQKAMNLLDERHAVLELAKGKLTTDPARHSGEGIFFTSRMFDDYAILSGGVSFSHEFGKDEDWILEKSPSDGTGVYMQLNNHTARTAKKVFDQFSSEEDDYKFNKTIVPVKLAQYGNDQLVSRSQAKRLLARVELFKIVIFDFKDVPTIGQAFADEIFRVFARQHPEMELHALHASSEVKRMIERAKTGAGASDAGPAETSAPSPDGQKPA
jgi:anti-sigma regulatory factor (Ser/Thr protein kinase)/biotin operon repressor